MNTRPFLVQNEANFTLFKIPFEKYNEKLSLSNNFFKYEKTFSDNTKVKNLVLTEISRCCSMRVELNCQHTELCAHHRFKS